MSLYERLVGGFTDRGDHIDTVKGHVWINGSNPIRAKCGHMEPGYNPTVHQAIYVVDANQMCDDCYAAIIQENVKDKEIL